MIARHLGPCLVMAWSLVGGGVSDGVGQVPPDQANEPQAAEVSPAPSSLDAVRQLITDGRYADAEQASRELLIQSKRDSGENSVETAELLQLLAQAMWRGGKVADPETLSIAQRAVAIKEEAVGPHDVRLATALVELSNVRYARSEYAECRPILERALAIYEAALGPDAAGVAGVHNSLGKLCNALYDRESAESHLRTALQIYEKTSGPESDDVADVLENLGNTLSHRGAAAEAEALYRRSLVIREELHGQNHLKTANSYNNLGNLHRELGEYELAKEEIERALAIREEFLPPGHPLVITTLANQAIVYSNLGLETRPIWERAITLADTYLGRDHELAAGLRANWAVGRQDIGVEDMKKLREEALAVFEKVYGPDHPRVAWVLSGLAEDALYVGDYEAASQYLERAIQADEKRPEMLRPYYAAHLATLAQCRGEAGKTAEARALFERSLTIIEESSGPEHLDVKGFLMPFGDFLRRTGDVAGARAAYARAIAIDQRAWDGKRSDPNLLVSLADLEADAGRLEVAGPLFERALAVCEQQHETEYASYATTLLKYSAYLLRAGDGEASLDAALRGADMSRRRLQSTLANLPERQALGLVAKSAPGADLAVSAALALSEPMAAASALNALVRSRALVLDEMGQRHRTAWLAQMPEMEQLVDAYVAASVRLANLTVQGTDEISPEKHVELLQTARREKEAAEEALAERSATFRATKARRQAGLSEVAASLPRGSALVSYFRFPRQWAGPQDPPSPPIDSYAAFILHSATSTPVLLDLGAASEIDDEVTALRRRLAEATQASGAMMKSAEASYRRAGENLRRHVWDPLEPHLHGAETVFIVPDGPLNLVSFAALPVGSSEYLIEKTSQIHNLSAERDLLVTMVAGGSGVLAVGDPAFDEGELFAALRAPGLQFPQEQIKIASARLFRGHPSSCGDFTSLHFERLPSSGLEVEDVVSTWGSAWAQSGHRLRGSNRTAEAKLLEGAAASELAVKLAAPGKDVLHLATHGFFLGEGCPSALDARGGATSGPMPTALLGENPLLLSGLALAGANHREAAGPDEDDGILTAEEIAALDLEGVKWAVLSACDTGLGQIRAGEGVLGLRRAFQVAGARTVIMSLWPVEDEASRHWMRALYSNRLSKGMSTVDAVHAASLELLRQRREAGLSTHPFYWAGFVATGDWR
jgi:CHAT domain-containing protein